MKRRNPQGFTLLELIIAIVILGILAVVAAPRFLNLQDDAYQAKMESIADQFETGVRFTQSQWLVNGGTQEAQTDIDGYGGGELDVNEFGFPLGTNKGNRNGVIGNPYNIGQGNAGCIAVWQALLAMNTLYQIIVTRTIGLILLPDESKTKNPTNLFVIIPLLKRLRSQS